jgi:hypothetical protein
MIYLPETNKTFDIENHISFKKSQNDSKRTCHCLRDAEYIGYWLAIDPHQSFIETLLCNRNQR